MRKFWFWLIVFALVLVSPRCADIGNWIPGLVHLHTTSSDGYLTALEVAERIQRQGGEFGIVTDHYDIIDDDYSRFYQGGNRLIGFENYFNACREASRETGILLIPGAEISTRVNPKTDLISVISHTLAISSLDEFSHPDPTIEKYQESPERPGPVGATGVIVSRLRELSTISSLPVLSVAAHPSNFPYSYDRKAIDLVDGIEFFNSNEATEFSLYFRLLKEGREVFVTAGCDSHVPDEYKNYWSGAIQYHITGYLPGIQTNPVFDVERWQKLTFVGADQISTRGILEALRQHRSYATNRGARIVKIEIEIIQGDKKYQVFPSILVEMPDALKKPRSGFCYLVTPGLSPRWQWSASLLYPRKVQGNLYIYERNARPGSSYTYGEIPQSEVKVIFYIPGELITSPLSLDDL